MSRPRPSAHGVLARDENTLVPESTHALDLVPGDLWLAETLAALQPKCEPEDRTLLVRMILATLEALETGSTALPLSALGALTGATPAALRALLTDPRRSGAVVAVIERTDEGTKHTATEPSGAAVAAGLSLPARPLLLLPGDRLALRRVHLQERTLAARLLRRLSPASTSSPGIAPPAAGVGPKVSAAFASLARLNTEAEAAKAIDDAIDARPENTPALDVDQRAACVAALRAPLTVITGGPGTGKTTIVATLLRAIARSAPEALGQVALTAPTGKAADRLAHVIDPETSGDPERTTQATPQATTLHRLLGYRPRSDTFLHHENNPLEAALLICDEASMIDLPLMDHLLRALLPGARLLLLGDAEQLPPVRAGAVLRDLGAAPRAICAIHRLERSHRQRAGDPAGASILLAAAHLLEGSADALLQGDTPALRRARRPEDLTFTGAEFLETPDERARQAFLARWEARHLVLPPVLRETLQTLPRVTEGGEIEGDLAALSALLRHHERAALLCTTRVRAGGSGATAVNAHLAGRLAARLRQPPGLLAPGTPVMVTVNDYAHGLFNGDTGLVLRARPGSGASPEPMAFFAGARGLHAFSLATLASHLEPAWAITVHKAQGSEYDEVAILLPAVDVRGQTRELLYTALTRARRAALFVGAVSRFEEACAAVAPRHTTLPALLA